VQTEHDARGRHRQAVRTEQHKYQALWGAFLGGEVAPGYWVGCTVGQAVTAIVWASHRGQVLGGGEERRGRVMK